MKVILQAALALGLLISMPATVRAVSSCGGLQDNCPCNGNNPYPCCSNNGNCTWYAWHSACCHWGVACPPWGNANTWSGYAASHPDFDVTTTPTANCIANRVTPQYPGDQWGHVAWVESVGNSVKVTEQGCWAWSGVKTSWYGLGFFDKYICLHGGTGPVGPSCGDGNCDSGEGCANCPQDCGACCGNGSCGGGETCQSCPQDCGACCGNGTCDYGETCQSCEQDCGECCGNGACDYGETCQTCEADCGPCCPNGACDYGETCQTCEADCGPCCGNGTCDSFIPEHCFNCPQDCGKCCGNGSCDWGENCDSCDQDCGICVYMPQGYLEAANCTEIRGWADDPDATEPVDLEILVDGEVQANLVATLPTDEHGDSGFALDWPEELKDGEPHLVEVRAFDDTGTEPGFLPGSGVWVLCGSGELRRGIWTITAADAGGIDIDLSPTFAAGSALALVHPGNLAWPLSGSVEARAVLGPDPLDEVRFLADGGFDPALYLVELLSGGDAESFGAMGERVWAPPGQPAAIGVRLGTLAHATDPVHRFLEMTAIEARTGPWWNRYSWDAEGITWEHLALDRVAFERRTGVTETHGEVSCAHTFPEPFDGFSFTVDQDLIFGLAGQLLVDGALVVQMGPAFLEPMVDLEWPGQELGFRFTSTPHLAAPDDAGLRIEDIRVFRSMTSSLYPWQLTWDRAWGLDGTLPAPDHHGLAVRLEAGDPEDWFATGTLHARTQVGEATCRDCEPGGADPREPEHDLPAFDRVRGLVSWHLDAAFSGQIRVNDEVVRDLTGAQAAPDPFELTKDGWFLSSILVVDPAEAATGEAWIEVTGVSFHRGGWWTTADNDTRGISDGRIDDSGIFFQAQPGWAEAGLEAQGQILVHREYAAPATGVRFHRSGDTGGAGIILSLVIDGKDVETWTDPVGDADESWTGPAEKIGFRMVVPEAGVFAHPWLLEITGVEVQVGGTWTPASEHPEALSWEVECRGEACPWDPGIEAPPESGGEKSSGCAAGGRAAAGWGVLFLMLLIALRRFRRA